MFLLAQSVSLEHFSHLNWETPPVLMTCSANLGAEKFNDQLVPDSETQKFVCVINCCIVGDGEPKGFGKFREFNAVAIALEG